MVRFFKAFLAAALIALIPVSLFAADSNTVVTDKTPPTASAPSIVINNSDVCKSTASAAIQTQILGFASGITVTDSTCEMLKLARSLYAMGMMVAGVSVLCQDSRVWSGMMMAGTPCPYNGLIGSEARQGWLDNPDDIPEGSTFKKKVSGEE